MADEADASPDGGRRNDSDDDLGNEVAGGRRNDSDDDFGNEVAGGRRDDSNDDLGDSVTDGGVRSYTVRLELVDEPGELLRALEPIAENGGNLLSIFHERGNMTPRGHIPVEVDIECPPNRFEDIVDALREAGVNVIQAGAERYSEEVSVLLAGHIIDTDLSDTLNRIEECSGASVVDISLSSPEGTDDVSSARLRLAVESGRTEDALSAVRVIADEKGLSVVEPLTDGGEAA